MPKGEVRKNKSNQLVSQPAQNEKSLLRLKKKGVFSVSDAEKLKLSQRSLMRLVVTGQVQRVGPGLYLHNESDVPYEDRDYSVACARFGPDAVVGGLSALFYYGLIEQAPRRIWVMVPYSMKSTSTLYRCIRTKTDPKLGVTSFNTYRMTNLERTLVEAFRYASKIGLRIALHAARTALVAKRTTLPKIYEQAKILGLEKWIERHWESMVSESDAA